MTRFSLAAAAAVLLTLTGCATASPEPSPTEAEPARCSPLNSNVTWGEQSPAERQPIGFRATTTDDTGELVTSQITEGFQSRAEFEFVGDPRSADARWLEFLVDDLNRSGEVDVPVGELELELLLGVPPGGEVEGQVLLFDVAQRTIAFSFECGGGPGAGAGVLVTTAEDTTANVTVAHCGQPLEPNDPLAETLARACA